MLEALEDRRMLAITIDVGDHNLLPDTPNQRIGFCEHGGRNRVLVCQPVVPKPHRVKSKEPQSPYGSSSITWSATRRP